MYIIREVTTDPNYWGVIKYFGLAPSTVGDTFCANSQRIWFVEMILGSSSLMNFGRTLFKCYKLPLFF